MRVIRVIRVIRVGEYEIDLFFGDGVAPVEIERKATNRENWAYQLEIHILTHLLPRILTGCAKNEDERLGV
jgi:hypothetical protein